MENSLSYWQVRGKGAFRITTSEFFLGCIEPLSSDTGRAVRVSSRVHRYRSFIMLTPGRVWFHPESERSRPDGSKIQYLSGDTGEVILFR
jgi:hypothetical protein